MQFLSTWEEDFVEVPGYEHNHEHDHYHHGPVPEICDDAHLDLQKHLYQSIKNAASKLQENREGRN